MILFIYDATLVFNLGLIYKTHTDKNISSPQTSDLLKLEFRLRKTEKLVCGEVIDASMSAMDFSLAQTSVQFLSTGNPVYHKLD